MNPRSQDSYTQAYNRWVMDQTPENMADLVSVFMPTINSELQQYSGSRNLLRARAKSYVINAVRTYDPLGKANLNSWVVTNLKQLARYGKRLRPIRASEDVIRNSAELNRIYSELEDSLGRKPTDEELQDATGWSTKMIEKLRAASISAVTQSASAISDTEQGPEDPGVARLDNIPYTRDAVYMSLNDRDKAIFDHRLGAHGKSIMSGQEIANKLRVTPAYISQRAAAIGELMSKLNKNGR